MFLCPEPPGLLHFVAVAWETIRDWIQGLTYRLFFFKQFTLRGKGTMANGLGGVDSGRLFHDE